MINIKCKKKHNYLKYYYQKILDTTLELFEVKSQVEVNVEFVSARKIRKINANFRNVDKVTDVLSFPNLELTLPLNESLTYENCVFDVNPETNFIMLGDIYINYKKVKLQAKDYGHSVLREACYLFTHGILHLLGFDHMEEKDKTVMREYEEKILNKINIQRN